MNEFEQKLAGYQERVERALDRALTFEPCPQQAVIDAMRYSLLGGGKRIRAVLLLEFAGACGISEETALPFAAALEMDHAYSLIHDDLPCMDAVSYTHLCIDGDIGEAMEKLRCLGKNSL